MQDKILRRNKVVDYSKIKKTTIRKKTIAEQFKKKKSIKSVNKDMFKIDFFNQKIIKYN